MSSAIVRAFHGSPTQNPSIFPTFIFATICAGGTTISETSLSGLIPPAPSQNRVHIACVPGGNVIADVIGVPAAFAASTSGLSAFGSAFTLPANSFFTVLLCQFRLSIHRLTIGFSGDALDPIVAAL